MSVIWKDITKGILYGCKLSKTHIIDSYIKIPIGLLVMLMILYGVNEIILKIGISFPASVTCMLVLYFFLLCSSKLIGHKRTMKYFIKYLEVPAGFSLRWINIFFTPAFMTLPKSERIGVAEAFIITAVFIIGYLMATVIIAYFTIVLQQLLKMTRKSDLERAEELKSLNEDGSSTALGEDVLPTSSSNLSENSIREYQPSITSQDIHKIQSNLELVPDSIIMDLPRGDEDQYEEEYRKSLENSRRNSIPDIDYIDESSNSSNNHNIIHDNDENNSMEYRNGKYVHIEIKTNKDHEVLKIPSLPSPIANLNRPTNPGVGIEFSKVKKLFCKRSVLNQEIQVERYIQIGEFIHKRFDLFIFGILFIVGLPIYFTISYEMFLHLSISIFSFIFILNFPIRPKIKRFLHPVLFSVGLSLLVYYIFALIKGESFLKTIENYKTGRNYLTLFKMEGVWPGAGDVLSSLLDVSIVALSLPMYTYRYDLWKHLFALLPPILVMSVGCFFIYPPLCYHIGISAERALGFAGRSVTLALGTPFVIALNGSIPLMACATVVSGVVGALTGQTLFRWLRVRDDDYVTRGLTLGVNCGAIATAHLLTIDPRAAAISSLSFVLFGTIMVIMASIPALSNLVQGWVGL